MAGGGAVGHRFRKDRPTRIGLHPDGLAQTGLVDGVCAAFIDDLAPRHGENLIGQTEGEIKILFNKNDRHGLLAAKIGDYLANLTDDIGLDALGRFIKKKKLWLGDQGPCDGKLLLLAA